MTNGKYKNLGKEQEHHNTTIKEILSSIIFHNIPNLKVNVTWSISCHDNILINRKSLAIN